MQYKFSYRKRNNGWQVILSYKMGNSWKQKSKQGFPTKRDAQSYGDELLANAEASASLTTDKRLQKVTFGDFVEIYLNSRRQDLRASTLIVNRSMAKRFAVLADMPIADITYLDLVDALSDIKRKYAPTTVSTTITILKTVMKASYEEYHVIPANPAARLKASGQRTPRKALDEKQLKSLFLGLEPIHRINDTIIYLAATTGARLSEILGLCVTDIDMKRHTISIRRQYNITSHGWDFAPVKNKNGVRTIPVPAKTIKVIESYMVNRKVIPASGQLFPPTCTYRYTVNNRIHELVGNGYSIHCLRHTYATRLIASGMDVQTVAALMGDTVATVMGNYSHYTEDMRLKAAEKVEAIF